MSGDPNWLTRAVPKSLQGWVWHYQGSTAGVWQETRLIPSHDHRMLITVMLGKPLELFSKALSKVRWLAMANIPDFDTRKGNGLVNF